MKFNMVPQKGQQQQVSLAQKCFDAGVIPQYRVGFSRLDIHKLIQIFKAKKVGKLFHTKK